MRSESSANQALEATSKARQKAQREQARYIARRVSLDVPSERPSRAFKWFGTVCIGLVLALPMFVDALMHALRAG